MPLQPSWHRQPFRVALRTKKPDTWFDLGLELWRALSHTIETSGKKSPGRGQPVTMLMAPSGPHSHDQTLPKSNS
jgi:hypothetical protein